MKKPLFLILLACSGVLAKPVTPQEPINFQCTGSNHSIINPGLSGATFFAEKNNEITIYLESTEGQLVAFNAGDKITNIESVVLKIPLDKCTFEEIANGHTNRVLKSMWCYRSESVQNQFKEPKIFPPMNVTITLNDKSKIKFDNLDFKFTLTYARTENTAIFSSQNSIEVNFMDKVELSKNISEGKRFVVFKGNNLSCY